MADLFITVIYQASAAADLGRLEALENLAQEQDFKYVLSAARDSIRVLFKHAGFIAQTDFLVAALQEDLESTLLQSLQPIHLSIEDLSAPMNTRAPRFYSNTDIQELLGVSRVRVNKIRNSPGLGFPEPIYSKGHTTLWKAKEVDIWALGYRRNAKSVK